MLRGGETNGRRWVVLRVEGVLEETAVASAVFHSDERKRLAAKLGASKLEIPEMHDHVRIFDGLMHIRMPANRLNSPRCYMTRSPKRSKERLLALPLHFGCG
jgi:hypothetical protein